MISEFRLVGLSKRQTATLELLDTDKETIWAKVEMTKERFSALFKYCDGNWKDKKIAKVKHDGLREDGTPINPVVIEIEELDK